MAKNNKPENKPSKETKEITPAPKETQVKPVKRQTTLARKRPRSQENIVDAFDRAIDNFRSDFEDLLFPSEEFMMLPDVRVPAVDLENREKEFVLKAEMPGFKKDEVEINVDEDGIEISGVSGWKYDQKEDNYICKERACKSFYRYVDLPEEVRVDDVNANLNEGILEVTLPKKNPKPQKQKRKVQVK